MTQGSVCEPEPAPSTVMQDSSPWRFGSLEVRKTGRPGSAEQVLVIQSRALLPQRGGGDHLDK